MGTTTLPPGASANRAMGGAQITAGRQRRYGYHFRVSTGNTFVSTKCEIARRVLEAFAVVGNFASIRPLL